MNKIVFGLGRFNPPTKGHDLLIKTIIGLAQTYQAKPMLFVIDGEKSSLDVDKNPFTGEYRRRLISDMYDIKVDLAGSAYEALEILDIQGFNPSILVCGSDRVKQYSAMLDHIGFNTTIQGLDRNTGLAANISGTSARVAARQGDRRTFYDLMSDDMPDHYKEEMFNFLYDSGRKINVGHRHELEIDKHAQISRNRWNR